MSQACRFAVVLAIAFGCAAPAHAQQGARISGFYAGALGEGDTNTAAGGSVGYRFTPRFGFEFEALALPDFEIDGSDRQGDGVAFLSNFVAEFPSPARWLTPYVQGGGGVANIQHSAEIFFEDGDGRRTPASIRNRRGAFLPIPDGMHLARGASGRSETNLALSVGGGVDFTLWRGLAAGPNITFMKFIGGVDDIDLTRIGVRTTYRF